MSRTLFYYFFTGSLVTTPFALVYWTSPIGLEWVKVIVVGVAIMGTQMLLTVAYRYGTASYLSPLGYVTVIYQISNYIKIQRETQCAIFLKTCYESRVS